MSRRIEVVPYNPQWPALFEAEAAAIEQALGPELTAIYHIGSTAIPGIQAKPIIDLLGEVVALERVEAFNPALEGLAYIPRGEAGIAGRRFFLKPGMTERTHHLHLFEAGHPEVSKHLVFRDYMAAHPAEARAYGRLKAELARRFPTDIKGYMAGKEGFIKERLARAKAWAKAG